MGQNTSLRDGSSGFASGMRTWDAADILMPPFSPLSIALHHFRSIDPYNTASHQKIMHHYTYFPSILGHAAVSVAASAAAKPCTFIGVGSLRARHVQARIETHCAGLWRSFLGVLIRLPGMNGCATVRACSHLPRGVAHASEHGPRVPRRRPLRRVPPVRHLGTRGIHQGRGRLRQAQLAHAPAGAVSGALVRARVPSVDGSAKRRRRGDKGTTTCHPCPQADYWKRGVATGNATWSDEACG